MGFVNIENAGDYERHFRKLLHLTLISTVQLIVQLNTSTIYQFMHYIEFKNFLFLINVVFPSNEMYYTFHEYMYHQ